MCGIFGYLNYMVPVTRREILEILIQGLKRLEYRGYDSAGVAFEGSECDNDSCVIRMVKQKGKVAVLQEEIQNTNDLNFDKVYDIHIGIAHTRWATHGEPNPINSHPQRSDPDNEFVVVHNGIITNYKDIKSFLEKKGFVFESETDTEVIVKLVKHVYDTNENKNISFRECVEMAIQQLEGAFAMALMSIKYPGECVATRRGSPLLLGVKSKARLAIDNIPVFYSKDHSLHGHAHVELPTSCAVNLQNLQMVDGNFEFSTGNDPAYFTLIQTWDLYIKSFQAAIEEQLTK